VIRSDHLIQREQMVKCTKGWLWWLKTALRWKIPAEQHQRIQMVLLRERGMMQPLIAAGPCRREPCSLENADLEKRGAIT
jgi:hypothetical protein